MLFKAVALPPMKQDNQKLTLSQNLNKFKPFTGFEPSQDEASLPWILSMESENPKKDTIFLRKSPAPASSSLQQPQAQNLGASSSCLCRTSLNKSSPCCFSHRKQRAKPSLCFFSAARSRSAHTRPKKKKKPFSFCLLLPAVREAKRESAHFCFWHQVNPFLGLTSFIRPDPTEKPPMSLEEVLQKAKPFLIAYEGIQSQEEWEEAIKDLMERLPAMKELIDMYCGPDRVTAKQQQQELERVAKTLPENIPSSVKRFTDRAVLSLQSNPGWGWDKKCQFMDKVVLEVSKHYNQ